MTLEEEIIEIKNNKISNKSRESFIKEHYYSAYSEIIIFHNQYFKKDFEFKQKLYNYINNINTTPKCVVCKNNVNWNNKKGFYHTHCSKRCINLDINVKNKIINTNINNYGVNCVFKNEEIKEKIKNKINLLYGVDNISQSDYMKNMCFIQSPATKEKIKITLESKYNIKHPFEYKEFVNKSISTRIQKTIKLAKELLGNNIEITNNGNYEYLIKNQCIEHNEYIIKKKLFHDRVFLSKNQNPCIVCNPVNQNTSIKESEVREYVEKELNLNTIKLRKNRQEIDIYIPEFKLGIEFNGLYWHSDIYKNKNYHYDKTKFYEINNIKLLHVFEDDWIRKKDIVKDMIKRNLKQSEINIDINLCIIKEIDEKEALNFHDHNNIMNINKSKINIGICFNNEIVSLLSFNKHHNQKFNIVAFTQKNNINVQDDYRSIIDYFVKTYNPKVIIHNVDNAYENKDFANFYGFSNIKQIKPQYKYCEKGTIMRLEKSPNHKINKEYYKIYDCGKTQYILTLLP